MLGASLFFLSYLLFSFSLNFNEMFRKSYKALNNRKTFPSTYQKRKLLKNYIKCLMECEMGFL